MSEKFQFTRAERMHLLGQVLPAIAALKPTKYPPNKQGEQKHGKLDHVVAVWASRIVDASESVWQKNLDNEEKHGASMPASGGSSNASPI